MAEETANSWQSWSCLKDDETASSTLWSQDQTHPYSWKKRLSFICVLVLWKGFHVTRLLLKKPQVSPWSLLYSENSGFLVQSTVSFRLSCVSQWLALPRIFITKSFHQPRTSAAYLCHFYWSSLQTEGAACQLCKCPDANSMKWWRHLLTGVRWYFIVVMICISLKNISAFKILFANCSNCFIIWKYTCT